MTQEELERVSFRILSSIHDGAPPRKWPAAQTSSPFWYKVFGTNGFEKYWEVLMERNQFLYDQKDWKKFGQKNKSIALNLLFVYEK